MRRVAVAGLLIFLFICANASAAAVTQFQTYTSTGFLPLTTGFTPPPECSSLTIVHSQRYVAVYQGCVGADPSCCPQSGRQSNTYSPGICASGYVISDPHVGLDRLAKDTVEWQATCVPPNFTSCTRHYMRLPQFPMQPDPVCPESYYSQLPDLTTPLTVSVFYYEPLDYNRDSGLPWPYRVGFRTTTVLSQSWPTLTPAFTTPRFVLASHIVIRWRDSDFSPTSASLATSDGPSQSQAPGDTTPDPNITNIPSSVSSDMAKDGQTATTTGPMSACTTCSISPSLSGQLSPGGVAGVTVSIVLVTIGLVFGGLFCCFGRRKASSSEIELDDPGPNVGCLTWYKDEAQLDPLADIVFIHGLRGHRTRTWTKDGCCWPKDLLPQSLPGIRVLTFGYDSSVARVVGHPSRNNISNHARSLLSDLLDARNGDSQRPIIFVAHSLGGIIVKDALHKAREPIEYGRYHSIFDSTHSVIFLGTPHRGSAYARVGRSAVGIIRWVLRDTNANILRSLEYDSEILERISEDFRNTLAYRAHRKIKICSFAEELSMSFLQDPIVHARSAFMGLPDEITDTIWAHHRDLCRFSDENDPGYKRIASRIIEFVADAAAGGSPCALVVTQSNTSLAREVASD